MGGGEAAKEEGERGEGGFLLQEQVVTECDVWMEGEMPRKGGEAEVDAAGGKVVSKEDNEGGAPGEMGGVGERKGEEGEEEEDVEEHGGEGEEVEGEEVGKLLAEVEILTRVR